MECSPERPAAEFVEPHSDWVAEDRRIEGVEEPIVARRSPRLTVMPAMAVFTAAVVIGCMLRDAQALRPVRLPWKHTGGLNLRALRRKRDSG